MKKKGLLVSLCGVLLLTAGCGKIPKLENGQEVVANLEGYQITAEDLYKELKEQYGTSALVNLVDKFITEKEMEVTDSAKEYADSQIKNYKSQYGDTFATALASSGYESEEELRQEIIMGYMKNEVAEKYLKDNLSENEINSYYEKEIYGELSAKHILIKPDTTDSATEEEKKAAETAAYNKAKELIQQLKDGADFDTLAKENSDDTASAEEGGLISDFTKDEVVTEFWDATYALKDGEYTQEPVKSTYGYHIILRVSQKEKPALEDVIDDIKDTLIDKKKEEDTNLIQKAWVELRKKYNLDIIDTDVKSLYEQTISTLK